MNSFISRLVLCVAFANSALAHGFVSNITIDGVNFAGNTPGATQSPSIIRLVNVTSPVKGAANPDINCGPAAQPAIDVGAAQPGSKLTFRWSTGNGDGSQWAHSIGPLMTYMASCVNTTCDKFDSTKAKWFKIDEQGRNPNNASQWLQENIKNNNVANVTIPKFIAPGDYLIRHEIIAIHLATNVSQAEFYPSCAQLRINGTQTGAPTVNEVVSLPGGYSDIDPGLWVPHLYDTTDYIFPGPKVAAFASESLAGNTASTPLPTITTTVFASKVTQTASNKTCSKGTAKFKRTGGHSASAAISASSSATASSTTALSAAGSVSSSFAMSTTTPYVETRRRPPSRLLRRR
ncbi:hypothetical protein DXG01_007386 [Tephrocybe rancida]|nr:hypothetical protein DXG01_007386 [Tephrocybe rancida]